MPGAEPIGARRRGLPDEERNRDIGELYAAA